jgi:ribonuclease T2
MKHPAHSLALLFATFCISITNALAQPPTPPTPGEFESYTLAMTYEVDFCDINPDKKECKDGLGRAGLVLHGLWPNKSNDPKHTYQYCGNLNEEQIGKEWCAPDIDVQIQMTPLVLSALTLVMPGVESCLYNHEWYAHGTCSGLTVNDYFNLSATIAGGFRKLGHFEAFLVQYAGKTVTRQQLMDALIQDFGDKTVDAAIFLCREDKQTKTHHFTEVDLTLQRKTIDKFPAADSLGVTEPIMDHDGKSVKNLGSCPETGIVVSP